MDQLVEIIKVLGTPTREEIYSMNPNYTEFKFPKITAHPWSKVFSKRMPPDAVDLVRYKWRHQDCASYSMWAVYASPFFMIAGKQSSRPVHLLLDAHKCCRLMHT